MSGSTTPLATAQDVMPYSIGARYIAELMLSSGRAAVDQLSTHIPELFADWLQHTAATPTWPARKLGCSAPPAPPGYQLRDQTQLGALGGLAFLAAGFAEDLEIVAPLRADSIFLYTPVPEDDATPSVENLDANPNIQVLAVWLMRFDTLADAQAFEIAIPPPQTGDRTFTRSNTVVALATSTDASLPAASLLQTVNCQ